MTQALLTVGIPLHNEEKYIRQTLQSLFDQPFKNFRAIISENASSDTTYSIAKEFADRDDRITIIRQEKKLSALDNFRVVMNASATPYFMWLGGHDIILSDYMVKATQILTEQKNVSLVYAGVVPMDASGKKLENLPSNYNDDLDSKNLGLVDRLCKVASNSFACYATYGIMRTESAKTIPFVEMVGPDHLLLFHLATLGEIVYLQEPGIGARVHRTETVKERKDRYVREGIMSKDDRHPYENHALNFFLYVLKSSSIPFRDKWTLLGRLRHIFENKFNVGLKGLIRVSIFKLFRI